MLEKLKFCLAHPWTEERNALLCFSLHLQVKEWMTASYILLYSEMFFGQLLPWTRRSCDDHGLNFLCLRFSAVFMF